MTMDLHRLGQPERQAGHADPTADDAILLSLDIATLAPTIDTLAATSVGATSAILRAMSPAPVVQPRGEDLLWYQRWWNHRRFLGIYAQYRQPTSRCVLHLIGDLQSIHHLLLPGTGSQLRRTNGVWASSSQSFTTSLPTWRSLPMVY